MSQVNLLPPEILQRQKVRQLTYLVLGIGAGVILVIAAIFISLGTGLAGVNSDIRKQDSSNAFIANQNKGLQQYADLQQQAQYKQGVLGAAFAYEASFSSMLQDVSELIPSTAYLTGLTFEVTPPAPAQNTPLGPLIGSMKATGKTTDLASLAAWLQLLDRVQGWKNSWFTTATRDASDGSWTFQSGLDLTKDVLTTRGHRGVP